MSTAKSLSLLLLIYLACTQCNTSEPIHITNCNCDTSKNRGASDSATVTPYKLIRGALLATRFKSFEELKSVIKIEYFNVPSGSDSIPNKNSMVRITQCSNGREVINELASGISQGEMKKAQEGNFWDKIHFLINSPYAVTNRVELKKAYLLSRRMTELFGEGDPAFYDLAETTAKNINTPDLAFINVRDSTDKGYINSFNHLTSQAFITTCFSEQLADFIGDSHERYFHPELITGKFSEDEVNDLDNGPVDNYVDMINNKWGQELGNVLKEKYKICKTTYWTPELLANYLNDIQSYYSWAFQIGFKPISVEDEIVIRFSNKLNLVMTGECKLEII